MLLLGKTVWEKQRLPVSCVDYKKMIVGLYCYRERLLRRNSGESVLTWLCRMWGINCLRIA